MKRETTVQVIRPYVLRVKFSEGVTRDVDLEKELYGEVFEPLRDPAIFSQVTVDEELGTIVWPNGADFSPEFLYKGARSLTKA